MERVRMQGDPNKAGVGTLTSPCWGAAADSAGVRMHRVTENQRESGARYKRLHGRIASDCE